MEVEHFSNSSISCYLRSVSTLCDYSKILPDKLNENDIYNFLAFIKNERGLSRETVRNYLQGLRFMYRSIYKRIDIIQDIPYPKKTKSLPVILSGKELNLLFNSAKSLKHKMVLKIAYCGGLRRSEIGNLKLIDIDTKNYLLRIENSKGNKDRYTLLSKTLVPELQHYYKLYKPRKYLFNGKIKGFPFSDEGLRWSFTNALEKSGIPKKVSLHSLRHAFASHLLAMGTDLFQIQKLMGHNDIRTTMIYLQVNHGNNNNNPISPLDMIQK